MVIKVNYLTTIFCVNMYTVRRCSNKKNCNNKKKCFKLYGVSGFI